MGSQNSRERFKYVIRKETDDNFSTKKNQLELQEIMEEYEDELLEPNIFESVSKEGLISITVPNENEIVSWEQDCSTPVSFFKDEVWVFKQDKFKFRTVRVYFGQNHPGVGIDLSDPCAGPLRRFEKIIIYYLIPGKSILSNYKPASISIMARHFLHLYAYFSQNGYLIGTDDHYKSLETFNVQDLKNEIRSRMERAEGRYSVMSLVYSINKWILLSKAGVLPKEFSAPFSEKEFWSKDLLKEVALFNNTMTQSWEAIPFDSLLPLIKTAKNYLQLFAQDLLFLNEKFQEVKKIMINNGIKNQYILIYNFGPTKMIFDELLKYHFIANPETQEPWLKLTTRLYQDKYYILNIRYISMQMLTLQGASVFMLLLWTGMRRNELRNLLIDALIIDNNPLDLQQDVITQVNRGQCFDLLRTVTKTEEDPRGKPHLIPLPKIGAMAFAVLFEYYRKNREITGNKYLIPSDNSFKNYSKHYSTPKGYNYPSYVLSRFCSFVGVENQHPHKCRKTLATLMINHDPLSLELIRDLLCHKSVSMTLVYLMSLPGVSDDIKNYMNEKQREKVIDFLTDAVDGKLAGEAGNRTLDAVVKNIKLFRGEALATTFKTLISTLTENTNFEIIRIPAAWCLRFPSRVPWTAPCLPKKSASSDSIYPNPEKCRPWECKYAGHTTKDLTEVKKNLQWAKKIVAKTTSTISRAYYTKQITYWENVISQLENGRDDIVKLNIIEQALASGE